MQPRTWLAVCTLAVVSVLVVMTVHALSRAPL